jgi:tetratricopeptide (TPR) repeat protein
LITSGFADEAIRCASLVDSGDVYYAQFDNRKALGFYGEAYKLCRNSYDPAMKMTRALIDVGEDIDNNGTAALYEEALRFTDSLQARFPDSMQSYFLKAVVAGNVAESANGRKKLELAGTIKENVDKAIRLDSSFAPAYIVLGAYYREVAVAGPLQKIVARILYKSVPRATLQDSKRTLLKALELWPDNIFACYELAQTLIKTGEKKDAVRLLKKMQAMPTAWHMDNRLKHKALQLLLKIE